MRLFNASWLVSYKRIVVAMIFQELAKVAVVVVAHRLIERQRLAGHFHDAAGVFQRQAGSLGRFFRRRVAAQFLDQIARDRPHLAHRVDHVHRHANRAALIGNRSRDRLANPPGGVGRELVAASMLELVDRSHQAGVAFLDQVQEAESPIAVLLGDRDDQSQVAGRQESAWPHRRRAGYSTVRSIRRFNVAGLSNVIRM